MTMATNDLSYRVLRRSNGRSGVIFEAKICGKVGVLKMADLYKNEYLLQEILNKIKFYLGLLMDIPPKLLKYGILNEVFVFILTLLSGKSFAELDDVTEREKQLAIEGLQAIHAREELIELRSLLGMT
ncbi:4652_t:CDS:2, partial [Funneliformis mosseae]